MKLRGIIMVGVLAAALLTAIPFSAALAVNVGGDSWFDVEVSGPVSVRVGNEFRLTLQITNEDSLDHWVEKVMLLVLDPFSGKRVLGPLNRRVQGSIPAGGTETKKVKFPGLDASVQDQALSVIILVIGPDNTCRGASGWGFVVKP